jgi:hypothetical protein
VTLGRRSFRLCGTYGAHKWYFCFAYPALAGWANFCRAFGAEVGR